MCQTLNSGELSNECCSFTFFLVLQTFSALCAPVEIAFEHKYVYRKEFHSDDLGKKAQKLESNKTNMYQSIAAI